MNKLIHSLYKNDFSLHAYDRYYFGLRYLGNKFLLKKLKDLELKGKKILDIGSGRLILSSFLSHLGSLTTSIDLPEIFKDATVINRAKKHEIDLVGFKILPDGNSSLPFRDKCFSAVLLTEVIEHLNFSSLPLLKDIHRVLKDGGFLILTTPNVHNLENKINFFFLNKNIYGDLNKYLYGQPFHYHWRLFEKKEIVKILEDCSFKVLDSYYFNDILINKYSRYLYNGIMVKTKNYIKKFLYFLTCFLHRLKKQTIIIAIKNES